MAIVIREKFKHTYKGCIYMPRDENAIVGRKKTTNRVVQTMLQRKSGFFLYDKHCISMTTRAIRFIYAADFFYA